MPDQYTLEGFGQKIKAKYPQYKDVPDRDLAQKVLAKYPQYQESIVQSAPAPKAPEARTLGNYTSEAIRGVGRGLKNDIVGLKSFADPIGTATALVQQINQADTAQAKQWQDTAGQPLGRRLGATALAALENAPLIGGLVQHAEEGGERMASPEGVGAAAEGITTFEAPGVIGKGVAKLAPRVIPAVTGTSPRALEDLVKKTKAANDKVQEANQKIDAARPGEVKEFFDKKQAVKEASNARSEMLTRKSALQTGVRKLSDKFQEDLKARRDTAAEAADAKYRDLNAKLGTLPANGEFLPNALVEAAEKIQGSETEPAIFRDIEKKIGRGEGFSYSDLQGYYTEIGRELKKGSLPGDIYTAYNSLQEAIGGEMQRIASAKGLGPQLLDARSSWRNLKQTFYDPKSPLKKALDAKEPGGAIKMLAGKDRTGIAALAKFDPALARRANTIRGYASEAEGIKIPSESTKPAPQLAPRMVKQSPNLIDASDIQQAKAESLKGRAKGLRRVGEVASVWQLFHGHVGTAVAGYALSSLLENPRITELLTKATARDVAAIPQDLRGDLPRIVTAARAKGIKVSPFLEKIVQGAAMAPAPRPAMTTDEWQNPQQ